MIEWNCPCGNSYKFHGFKEEEPQHTWVELTEIEEAAHNIKE